MQEITDYKEEQTEKVVTFINRNIFDDLTIWQKNLFYFLWLPLINFPFKQNFSDDGYILKLKQANYYSLIGFISFMLSGFFSGMYNFSNLTSLTIWIIGFIPAYGFDEIFNRQNQIKKLNRLYEDSEIETQDTNERNDS